MNVKVNFDVDPKCPWQPTREDNWWAVLVMECCFVFYLFILLDIIFMKAMLEMIQHGSWAITLLCSDDLMLWAECLEETPRRNGLFNASSRWPRVQSRVQRLRRRLRWGIQSPTGSHHEQQQQWQRRQSRHYLRLSMKWRQRIVTSLTWADTTND